MADVRNIALTLQGGDISGQLQWSIGETVNINCTCLDPATGLALDLTVSGLFFTLSCFTVGGVFRPISREGTNTSPFTSGLSTIPIASGDTVPTMLDPIRPGIFRGDFWAEDASGNRVDLGYGLIPLIKQERLPGAPVTPLPSQNPLAQGPPGIAFNYVYKTGPYTARFNDQVDADVSGGGFNVTLPAISSLALGQSGLTQIINGAPIGSANTVGIVPAGSDKFFVPGTATLQTLQSLDPGVWRYLNPILNGARGGNYWVVS